MIEMIRQMRIEDAREPLKEIEITSAIQLEGNLSRIVVDSEDVNDSNAAK